jgi:hypothetical protein
MFHSLTLNKDLLNRTNPVLPRFVVILKSDLDVQQTIRSLKSYTEAGLLDLISAREPVVDATADPDLLQDSQPRHFASKIGGFIVQN